MSFNQPKYVLDAQTKKGLRLTSFSDDIESAVIDFKDWADEIKAEPIDIWYANVFNFATKEHLAVVHIDNKRIAVIDPAPKDSKEKMFKPNRLKAILKGEIK